MPKQVEVQVEDISTDEHGRPTELTGTTRILTYKSFLYLNANPDDQRYKLIGEVESIDAKGNVKLAPGNPNLNAQHKPAHQRSAEHAGSVGPSESEIQLKAENERLKALLANQGSASAPVNPVIGSDPVVIPPVTERKKPGPKKKQLTETAITA